MCECRVLALLERGQRRLKVLVEDQTLSVIHVAEIRMADGKVKG